MAAPINYVPDPQPQIGKHYAMAPLGSAPQHLTGDSDPTLQGPPPHPEKARFYVQLLGGGSQTFFWPPNGPLWVTVAIN